MTDDPTKSLQNELHQFVLQTQNRLDGLRTSLVRLREPNQATLPERDEIRDEPRLEILTPQEEQIPPNTHTAPAETFLPPASVADEEPIPEEPQRSSSTSERPPVDDFTSATDRLEAIKRRLADQIANA